MKKVKNEKNMYVGITHTHDEIIGPCYDFCHCARTTPITYPIEEMKKDVKLAKNVCRNFGRGNNILVGSTTDMWAPSVPYMWIWLMLWHLDEDNEDGGNHFTFQTRNPARYLEFLDVIDFSLGEKVTLLTSIASNEEYLMQDCHQFVRKSVMRKLSDMGYNTGLSIDLIEDIDLDNLKSFILDCKPRQVHVGFNTYICDHVCPLPYQSTGENVCKTPVPSTEKILALLDWIDKQNINLKVKRNLLPLIPAELRKMYFGRK